MSCEKIDELYGIRFCIGQIESSIERLKHHLEKNVVLGIEQEVKALDSYIHNMYGWSVLNDHRTLEHCDK